MLDLKDELADLSDNPSTIHKKISTKMWQVFTILAAIGPVSIAHGIQIDASELLLFEDDEKETFYRGDKLNQLKLYSKHSNHI